MKNSTRSLLVAILLLPLLSCNVSVDKVLGTVKAGIKSLSGFTFDEELEIGGTVAAKIASSMPINGNLRARTYVNHIAQTVAARSSRADCFPRVLIVESSIPNAFACPGGYMFVSTGLLRICQDESELAGILGHEFVHVAQKHTLSGLKWKRGFSVAANEASKYGSKELSALYGGFKNAVDKGINGVVENRHGARVEARADAFGAEWASLAGYNPAGLGRVIGRLPKHGEASKWLESFSVYKSGESRGQRILKILTKKGIDTKSGRRNAARYRSMLVGIL